MAADTLSASNCSLIGYGVTIVIGGLGGFFIRTLIAKRTADRKEDWDRITDLAELINDLTDSTKEYYCLPSIDQSERRKLGIRIQGMIRRAGQSANLLRVNLVGLRIDSYHRKLREAVTSEFSNSSAAIPETDDRIVAIDCACTSYIGAVHLAYTQKYRRADLAKR